MLLPRVRFPWRHCRESSTVQYVSLLSCGLYLFIETVDSDTVAQRYAQNAVLLPTVSDVPRTDYASIKDYFDNFLQLKPEGVILDSFVTTGKNLCKDVGIYEFTLGATGEKVRARYSFVYIKEGMDWKISHHHSSVMPEAQASSAISEEEVRDLFTLWNDALATCT